MGMTSQQKQSNDLRRIIAEGIKWWRRELGFSIRKLASLTGHSESYIKKVIDCEPVDIGVDFLRDCVIAFDRTSGRTKSYEDTIDILSFEEYVELLKPLPPRQGKLWD